MQEKGIVHFFGQIVIHNDEDAQKKYIIDGQQRTITSTIFIRVLQTYYEKLYPDANSSDYVKRNSGYKIADIASKHIGREDELHLILGDFDREYFANNIQLGVPDNNIKLVRKSHDRIRKAFKFFEGKLDQVLSQCADNSEKYDCLTK